MSAGSWGRVRTGAAGVVMGEAAVAQLRVMRVTIPGDSGGAPNPVQGHDSEGVRHVLLTHCSNTLTCVTPPHPARRLLTSLCR